MNRTDTPARPLAETTPAAGRPAVGQPAGTSAPEAVRRWKRSDGHESVAADHPAGAIRLHPGSRLARRSVLLGGGTARMAETGDPWTTMSYHEE
ncbi:hypothetical protein [Kitasatospora xanthocidica]|uniref:hypothetical protein n=1 Tax=Kitasatospora xanthocidica TaxID=83382 RepID=UPI0016752D16|nr:hypothetical protein [Kitasatospora xanthocidica]GHF85317.1 hypothetical protein GCM10018790_73570 [Kitasatospora xanthocidica]